MAELVRSILPTEPQKPTDFQRFILNPTGGFDAQILVKDGRLMVGPADDDGVVLDRKVSREIATELLRQQAAFAAVEGMPTRISAISELIDLKLQELEAER